MSPQSVRWLGIILPLLFWSLLLIVKQLLMGSALTPLDILIELGAVAAGSALFANLVANRHRARRVREAFATLLGRSPPRLSPAPDEAFERAETRVQIAEILARLPHKKREVFALFELEGLSGDEIAERLGCPVNTVWTRLHHARQEFLTVAERLGCLEQGGPR